MNTPIALRGYFQYVPAIERMIPLLCNDMIEFLTQERELLRRKYSLTDLTGYGFIHVRRGDYLDGAPNLHWVQTSEYYKEAMKLFGASRWFVLSDDPEWCKAEAVFAICEVVNEPDELTGLALMSLCHGGAIIANSTYSWWGAMLGANSAGSTVVYPSKWLQDTRPILFPETWIRI